jgi:drug/metabolite transporter (DMT)-like permease|tara:strand:- start:127 stop:963 length:837 start_codon:yes stop_codon:yes gene_type:complete
MTVLVFCAVLIAALLHAGWNALVKTGNNKQTAMLILTLAHAFFGLCLIPFLPMPQGEVWIWLLASGFTHMFYQLFLGFAYERGDLSRVYPIARGGAPMIVLTVSVLFGVDTLRGFDFLGILVLGLGILLMARGVFNSDEDHKLIFLAVGSACATACYSLIDGLGARVMGDALAYVSWLLIFSAIFYTPVIFFLRGRSVLPQNSSQISVGLLTGFASFVAYAIVVWAMTQAPIALVTALRGSSILFAMIFGWFFFREQMGLSKVLAGIMIVIGIILTRF